jgi:GGDEF domain-containing protein
VISILKSVSEIDRLEELRSTAMECYAFVIRSISQYAIEIDLHQAAKFRMHLEELERQWLSASKPEDLRTVQASFRGELREYRDQSSEHLARLRKELEAAATAMSIFADGVSSNSEDCETGLKRELTRLEGVTGSRDLEAIRSGVRSAVTEITAGLDQMRRADQLIVAQLQDEIRVLHQEFQAERKALFTDPVSGAWTRQKFDLRVHEMLRQDDGFSVIAFAMRNLPALERQHSANVVEGAVKALLMRFRTAVGEDASIGRWNENEFVTILEVDGSAAIAIAAELSKKLGGVYAVQENGLAHNVTIELAAGSLERPVGSDPASFVRKLERLTGSLLRDGLSVEQALTGDTD